MPAEIKKEIRLQIAHVLFMDIVAYSKMAMDEQRAAIEKLNQIVQSTEEYRKAEGENRLLKIATGDGMALIFYDSPEDPVECALEISRALKEQHPELRLRMGVNSGPVSGVVDVNGRANVAGAGINMAQRVMDCGDAGHILLSKRVAEDLEQLKHWRLHLHRLGECEVKHGDKIEVVNLFTAELGNPERPKRFTMPAQKTELVPIARERGPLRKPALIIIAGVAIATLVIGCVLFWQRQKSKAFAVAPAIPKKSIAVMPFENLSRDPDNAYFADGIQDEILTRLSKIADLKVISRTTTQHFKSAPENLPEIAKQLGAANVLEGSAQRVGDQVRVNVQLIDAVKDTHLWAETYDRKLTDVFAVESDIARTIAETLQAKLTGAEKTAISSRPTENAEAHLLYLKGRYHVQKLSKEELNKGLDYFKKAIALDPQYALAYDGIAYYHFVAIDWLASVSDLGPAWIEAAKKAVELDDTLAESHTELANAYFWSAWNWPAAETEFKRAIQLDPKYAPAHEYYGWYLVLMGRVDEGVAEFRRALEIDPLSAESNALFGWNLWVVRRYDDAMEQLRKALELDPSNWWAHANLGRCQLSKGTPSNALTEFRKAISIENSIAEPVAGLGMAYAALGKKAEATKVLDDLQERTKQNYVSPYFIASVYGALGEKDQAFAWLDKAFKDRSWYLLALNTSPEVDNLRSDPRFQKLVARVFAK